MELVDDLHKSSPLGLWGQEERGGERVKGARRSLRRLEETDRYDHTGRGQRNLTMVPCDGKEPGERELGVLHS